MEDSKKHSLSNLLSSKDESCELVTINCRPIVSVRTYRLCVQMVPLIKKSMDTLVELVDKFADSAESVDVTM